MPGRITTGSEGIFVAGWVDERFLDAFAALHRVNAGYGGQRIAKAVVEQAHALSFFPAAADHRDAPAISLSMRIMDLTRDHVSRVCFSLAGSTRGLARYHTRFHLPLGSFLHTEAVQCLRRPDRDMSEATDTGCRRSSQRGRQPRHRLHGRGRGHGGFARGHQISRHSRWSRNLELDAELRRQRPCHAHKHHGRFRAAALHLARGGRYPARCASGGAAQMSPTR